MRRLMLVVLAAAACGPRDQSAAAAADSTAVADSTPAAAEWRLTESGIGPVRVGMTVAEAAAALSSETTQADTQACAYVGLLGLPPGVSLMTERGRVVRVDVDDSSRVATARGARVGWTEV